MRVYLSKAEIEEVLKILQSHTDNPKVKKIVEYLEYRKNLPQIKKN